MSKKKCCYPPEFPVGKVRGEGKQNGSSYLPCDGCTPSLWSERDGIHCAMLAGGEGREGNFDVISVGRG